MLDKKSLNLDIKHVNLLDLILLQAVGYPICDAESKLGFERKELERLGDKLKQGLESKKVNDVASQFTLEDLIKLMKAVSLVYTEVGEWEFATVTGVEKKEVEQLYQILDNELREFHDK